MNNDQNNAFTGDNDIFLSRIKESIANADTIDIIVSFLMESGVKLIVNDLKNSNAKIRILTGNYLNITQPQALYSLKKELRDNLDLRFYNVPNKSFHPKAYIFHTGDDSEIYVGSSNLSRGALTDSIEWNYHFTKRENPDDFNRFYANFENLFNNHAIEVNDDVLRSYSRQWVKPKFKKIMEFQPEHHEFEPRGAQIEALYALENSREEGFDKALVVAATGVGKTYLAAFDSEGFHKILFVAHREEILKQAEKSFKNVYPEKSSGFFYGKHKDVDEEMIFASVQTLGKKAYLNEDYFAPDEFDYIVIDEFHHAAASSYLKILDYFKPEFMLGLTATPERLDNRDVFALCDYNSVYEVRLKEAINKGWLVPFRYYGIYDDTIDYSTVNMRNGVYDEKDLEEKLMINKRADLVHNHFLKYDSSSAIGFCSSRNHAEFMAKYFNEHKIPSAAVYSGEQGQYSLEKNDALRKLRDGDLKILFAVDIFNEGLDVPSIDTVLFLRPTQSPTIFLQQLGRGLRKDKGKKYLTVLDFIGNYRKANLVPFLLSGYDYETKKVLTESVIDEFEYPEGCYIDFDFQVINLFKHQAKNEMKVKDKILFEFNSVKGDADHHPTRLDLFLHMDEDVIRAMKRNSKFNLFRDYIQFLADNGELDDEEKSLLDTPAHDFLNVIENTSMTKSYKMPILKAFYNDGNVKMAITDDDVYQSFREFYAYKSNGVDMTQHKKTKNYKSWGKKQYVSLAKNNPIHFLKKSSGEFFQDRAGYALALNKNLEDFIHLDSFKQHFDDIIKYKTVSYYKYKFEKRGLK